jgi:hypothetical protein
MVQMLLPHPMILNDVLKDRNPSSFIAAIAFGFIIPDGFDPELNASTFPSPYILAKASLIWLRLLFSTQTKSIFFFMLTICNRFHYHNMRLAFLRKQLYYKCLFRFF